MVSGRFLRQLGANNAPSMYNGDVEEPRRASAPAGHDERMIELSRDDFLAALRNLSDLSRLAQTSLARLHTVDDQIRDLQLVDTPYLRGLALYSFLAGLIESRLTETAQRDDPRSLHWALLYCRYVQSMTLAQTSAHLALSRRSLARYLPRAVDELARTVLDIERQLLAG